MNTATEAIRSTEAGHLLHGNGLHRTLIAELSNAACFRPTTVRASSHTRPGMAQSPAILVRLRVSGRCSTRG